MSVLGPHHETGGLHGHGHVSQGDLYNASDGNIQTVTQSLIQPASDGGDGRGGQASLHRLSAGRYAAWQNLHQEGGIYIAAKAAAYLASLVESVTAKDSDAEPVAGTHPLYQASGGVIVLDNEDVQISGACNRLH